jgi:hypothetical protein
LLILAKLTEDTLRRIAETVAAMMGWNEAAIASEIEACRSESARDGCFAS